MKKLFCIPCGGTSAVLFAEWKKYFGDQIELIPLEIPGRGCKTEEGLKQDLREVAEELSIEIEQQVNHESYCILGLCFGALIGYEICRKFEREHKPLPDRLYICGSSSPCPKNPAMYTPFFLRDECRAEIHDMFRRLFPPQLFPDPDFAAQLSQQMVKIFYAKLDQIQLTMQTDPSEIMLTYDDVRDLVAGGIDQSMMEYMIHFSNALIASVMNDEMSSLRYYQSEKEQILSSVPAVVIYGTQDTILGDSWKEWGDWMALEASAPVAQAHFTLMWAAPEISAVIQEREESHV